MNLNAWKNGKSQKLKELFIEFIDVFVPVSSAFISSISVKLYEHGLVIVITNYQHKVNKHTICKKSCL